MCYAAYGMPADLEYQADGGGLEPASTCRVLHALIKQRQRDIDRGKEAAERLSRMGHDLRVRDQQREKMLQKLAAKERELGALENKVSEPGVLECKNELHAQSNCMLQTRLAQSQQKAELAKLTSQMDMTANSLKDACSMLRG